MRRLPLFAAILSGLVLLRAPAVSSQPAAISQGLAPPADEKAGFARHAMVAAANPLAVEAGLNVLKRGGTAVDAAVAIQAVLGLVEPQSSGLGGGAFMTYYDGATHRLTVYNGRETAPAGARPDMFLGPDGKPMPFIQAILSGRSTGVPGAVAMLGLAQREHGKLAWPSLFADATRLADQGFTVSPRLGEDINGRFPQAHTPDANAYFTKPDGTRYRTGDLLRNPAYAATLRKIAAEGPPALYTGKIAEDIAASAQHATPPGTLTAADIAAYRPIKAEALCRPYRIYVVCAPPPPAGGVGVLEILGILEGTDIALRGPNDPQAWYEFAQASRLGYADRDHYEGDPRFVHVPVRGMLDPAYDAQRARLIPSLGPAAPAPGNPPGASPAGRDRTAEPGGTTHFVVVDQWGNAVSMTTTVESIFGSGRMADGFFLNNQLTDFSFSPTEPDGTPAANAVAPLKQPRSSMSPTIILDRQGRLVAAVGSPGGNSIVAYVAKAIVGIIDWKLPVQQALDLPNIVARGSVVSVEKGADPRVVAYLQSKGLNVKPDAGEESGLHGFIVRPGGYEGGADRRREGVARGY